MTRLFQAPFRIFASLRWRLTTAISGLILLCTAACVAGSVLFLRQTLTDRATADLRHSITGVAAYLSNQRGDLQGSAVLIASDPRVATAVLHRDRQALILQLKPYYADLNVDVVDVTNRAGTVLVRMENTDAAASGDSLSSRPDVRDALAGHSRFALGTDMPRREAAAGYALRATIPLFDGSHIIGAMIVGRQLDSIYASRLGRAVNADINIIAGNQLTGSTLTDTHGLTTAGIAESQDTLRRIAAGKTSMAQLTEDNQTVLSGLVPIAGANGKPAGAVEVVSRLDPLYELIRQLSILLIALGAGVVILGTLLALDIARRLTRRLLALESTASLVANLARSDAPVHHLQMEVTVNGDDEIASLARSLSAMMHSLDDRMAINAGLYRSAQSRVRELTGLAEIARLLTAVTSVRETLDVLGEHVCRLVGCSAVAIWLPSDGPLPALHGGHGLPAGYEHLVQQVIQESEQSESEIASLAALRTGELKSQSLNGDANGLPEHHARLRDVAHSHDWGRAVAVPLRVKDKIVGAVTCYLKSPSPLIASDLSLLWTIADQVAVAVENARLYTQSRDVAALEERTRLARELHDSVTQALFSMTLHARAVQMALPAENIDPVGRVARGIVQLHDLTQGALAEMRALIFELRPGALQDEGLAVALQKHAAALSAREGVDVTVDAPEARLQLPCDVEEHLYRIAQEALHNIVKHANAAKAVVRISPGAKCILLEVIDDGDGFEPDDVAPGHLGLGTMAQRAAAMGGTLQVKSSPGHGARVRAKAPMRNASVKEPVLSASS